MASMLRLRERRSFMLLDWAVCCHGGKVEPGDIGDSSAGVKSLRLADDCRWRVLVGVVDVLRDAARLPGCLGGATVVTLNLPSPSFLPVWVTVQV
jgi:hypothetical protein